LKIDKRKIEDEKIVFDIPSNPQEKIWINGNLFLGSFNSYKMEKNRKNINKMGRHSDFICVSVPERAKLSCPDISLQNDE
jgi:hypothetical protein